jgi:biopolymer transport protein ExbB/TolQ
MANMDSASLSPWGLFMQAGPVGKCVMALLLLASIWCWTLIVEGALAVRRLRAAVVAAAKLAPIASDGEASAHLRIEGEAVGERRARIVESMNRAGRRILAETRGGLPNLATIASVSPFIGLFGTVWGVMTSFAGIATAQDTSLAVVAPGIAEALAATAYGLAAAIPASIAYNRLGAALGALSQALGDLIERHGVVLSAREAEPEHGA